MSLDLSAAALIRAGGSFLWLVLGVFVLAVGVRGNAPGPDRRWRSALAVYALAAGVRGITLATAVADADLAPAVLALGMVLSVVSAGAVAVFVLHFARSWRSRALAGGVFLVHYAAVLNVLSTYTGEALGRVNGYAATGAPWSIPFQLALNLQITGAWALFVVLPLAYRAASDVIERRRILVLAVGIFLGFGLTGGRRILRSDPELLLGPAEAAVLILVAALWLAAARGAGARAARNVALFTLAIPLVGMADAVFFGRKDIVIGSGALLGLGSIVSVAILTYGFVRFDILGVPIAGRTVQRSSLAAGTLAALFITAQVAQEFLAAQYGLLMGGVVAGAFLFAAQPLQRAFEGRGPAAPTGAAASDDLARRSYREAVRHALRDRVMSRAEELHLTELAEALRLPASEALRIRHDIEDELRGVRA